MSKRNFPSTSNPLSTKKARTDELSNFWDDEIDVDLIDDCFERATQIGEIENPNNVSLAASYSIFKAPNQLFTSTQATQGGNLEDQVRQLQEKYAEKEGEVSILRSNLQNLRTTSQAEEERKHNEWKEKLSTVEKQNKSIRSELVFKNLEIVNLKQKVNELSKLVSNDVNVTQNKIVVSPKKQEREVPKINYNIHINVEKYYPLKNIQFSSVAKITGNKNEIVRQTDFIIFFQNIVPSLVQCSDIEMNSAVAQPYICKALKLAEQLMDNFNNCLKQPERFSLQFQELLFMCSDILELLGQIINSSDYLQDQILLTEGNFMSLLSNIFSSIVTMKKEKSCSKFLFSALIFLCKTTLSTKDCFIEHLYGRILDQCLVLRLDLELVNQVISFLNIFCIRSSPFTEITKTESCKFYTFYNSLESILDNIQNIELFVKITDNLLNFAYNLFKLNDLHQRKCDCSHKLYKLIIRCVYKNLECYQKEFCQVGPSILKKCVNILSLINFNSFDTTQKSVSDLAQFKEIVNRLVVLNAPDATKLEKLYSNEDIPNISSDKFKGIDL